METYVQRNYGQKKASGNQKAYPFWDYRSRRGSITTSSSSSSHDGSSISSMSSTRSETESENVSLSGSDTDSISPNDPNKISIQFFADAHEIYPLYHMFQPVINWIDPDMHLFKITERESRCNRDRNEITNPDVIPSIAVIVFLHEEGMLGCERIQSARHHFEKCPWKFHHSEHLKNGTLNPYPYNSQEFYYTSEDLPLWAVRQVHYGKEHIRIVIYASAENWDDTLEFYKLILGTNADLQRSDFCMFVVHTQIHYDVQFALKRLPNGNKPKLLDSVTLQFRVSDVGHIVPLFPNICQPISDNRWQTTDHDGNSVFLEVVGNSTTSTFDKIPSQIPVTFDKIPSQVPVAFDKIPPQVPVTFDKIPSQVPVTFDKIHPQVPVTFDKIPPQVRATFDKAPPPIPPKPVQNKPQQPSFFV